MKLSSVGNKKTLIGVVWLIVIIAVLYFFKKLMGGLMVLFGDAKTEEQEQTEKQQMELIRTRLEKALGFYKGKTSKNRDEIKGLANSFEQAMNKQWTDWAFMANSIKALNTYDLYMLYLEFGSRLNTEFNNLQGDLFDWIVKEDGISIDIRRKPYIKFIKERFLPMNKLLPEVNKLQQL